MLQTELQEIQRKDELDKREEAIRAEVSGLAAQVKSLELGFAAQLARIETLQSLAARIDVLEKKAAAPQPKK